MAVDLSVSTELRARLTVDQATLDGYTGAVPRHIAIIMDGNGRWAQARGMRRLRGHHEGAHAVRRAVESCRYLGVEALTLYAFSEQNWGRPEDEVSGLMSLFDLYIKRERARLIENQVAIRVIGDRGRLPERLQRAIAQLEAATDPGHQMVLQVAVSYGGREELVRAARLIAEDVRAGRMDPEDVDEAAMARRLYTAGVPDPELIIRTSGELRVSNFLLWQLAYSELYVMDELWPDFNEALLVRALESFGGRERRYGKTSAQIQQRA